MDHQNPAQSKIPDLDILQIVVHQQKMLYLPIPSYTTQLLLRQITDTED